MQTQTYDTTHDNDNADNAVDIVLNSNASLEEVEALTNELKRLLVRHETLLEQEGIKHQIEVLERWMESYRRGLAAAYKLSQNGITWLNDLRERLKLAADELQRLEGEGGNPATAEQIAKAEELIKAIHRIDEVAPSVEHIFCHENTEEKKAS